ncbi:Multimeric flavodoxin WrbA [Desulfacinum hydrothermale DSM 13146]|uniref:Multimeric flavodoxin WrbA n=1 Tax=Desulfacinum hydrothermale DSM 13146 TaxID=1121390 RepID=A0A1W1XAY2_9BACT|nr:flavodoxin family protein [Desulfacinum hydrothermale]SMC20848.1 Multimeric flavodoxin WrbA [Desulfacinum hydrothermale DSM 13146]
MQVLGIYGSPRKGGNTDRMLDAFLEGAVEAGASVERVYVRRLKMQGCVGCGGCDETGTCVVDDGMQSVYPLLEGAEGVVVATPIYFYNVTGQLKLLIDRCQALFMKKQLGAGNGTDQGATPPRKGFLLSAAATRGKRLFDCALLTMHYFLDAIGGQLVGDLCFRELEGKTDVAQVPDLLAQCREAGRRFAGE